MLVVVREFDFKLGYVPVCVFVVPLWVNKYDDDDDDDELRTKKTWQMIREKTTAIGV